MRLSSWAFSEIIPHGIFQMYLTNTLPRVLTSNLLEAAKCYFFFSLSGNGNYLLWIKGREGVHARSRCTHADGDE